MATSVARLTSSRSRLEEQEEYLQLRQRFKEDARRKMKKEGGNGIIFSSEERKGVASSATITFGNFFGPSQPYISQRVIQESKAKFLAAEKLSPKKLPPEPAVPIDGKQKVQILKKNRDYSCLFSETEDTKSLSTEGDKAKSVPASCNVQSKALEKTKKMSASIMATPDLNRSSSSAVAKRPALIGFQDLDLPGKTRSAENRKPDIRDIVAIERKQPVPKLLNSSGEKRKFLELDKVVKRKPAEEQRKKRLTKVEDENLLAFAMMRKITGYDPNKYARLDSDDRDMEASFHDIQKEESRSARLAREEDKREQLLIEEEEKRATMRKEAKRRKPS